MITTSLVLTRVVETVCRTCETTISLTQAWVNEGWTPPSDTGLACPVCEIRKKRDGAKG